MQGNYEIGSLKVHNIFGCTSKQGQVFNQVEDIAILTKLKSIWRYKKKQWNVKVQGDEIYIRNSIVHIFTRPYEGV